MLRNKGTAVSRRALCVCRASIKSYDFTGALGCDSFIPIVVNKISNRREFVDEFIPFLNPDVLRKPHGFFKRKLVLTKINDDSSSKPYIIENLIAFAQLLIFLNY